MLHFKREEVPPPPLSRPMNSIVCLRFATSVLRNGVVRRCQISYTHFPVYFLYCQQFFGSLLPFFKESHPKVFCVFSKVMVLLP